MMSAQFSPTKPISFIFQAAILSFSFLAASCGGGGGGSSTSKSVTPTNVDGGSGNQTFQGTLYYDSFWSSGFVSYSFKDQKESLLLKNTDYYKWAVVSPDSTWLGSAVETGKRFHVANLKNPSVFYNADYAPDYIRTDPVFSPDGSLVMQQ